MDRLDCAEAVKTDMGDGSSCWDVYLFIPGGMGGSTRLAVVNCASERDATALVDFLNSNRVVGVSE